MTYPIGSESIANDETEEQFNSFANLTIWIKGESAQMENTFSSILEGLNFKIFPAPQRPSSGGFECH